MGFPRPREHRLVLTYVECIYESPMDLPVAAGLSPLGCRPYAPLLVVAYLAPGPLGIECHLRLLHLSAQVGSIVPNWKR